MVSENYDGQTLFLRSESEQLFSENVNVTVGKLVLEILFNLIWLPLLTLLFFYLACDMPKYPHSCSKDIDTTAGVISMICVVVIVIVIPITMVLCWWR